MPEKETGPIPEQESENGVAAEELTGYLSRKGAVELFCEIESGGSRFNELARALDISTTTLSKRLGEGQKVGLIQMKAMRGEQGAVHTYTFTESGRAVGHYLIDSQTIGAYQTLRQAQENFEEKAEKVREWTAENGEIVTKNPMEVMEFMGDFRHESDAFDN